MSLLEISGLTKQFGGLTAVDNVSFHIDKNQICALIGPNGAGKTTAFNPHYGCLRTHKGYRYLQRESAQQDEAE